jgi:hypothetical protein
MLRSNFSTQIANIINESRLVLPVQLSAKKTNSAMIRS